MKFQSLSFFISTALLAFSSFDTMPVKAASVCKVDTRDQSSLTVYRNPNGESINALRFGREVEISNEISDNKGQKWVKVGSEHNGGYRQWGWVIKKHLNCGGQTQATSSASNVCKVDTRDQSSLTVYRQPNGESINALRFGREVEILSETSDNGGKKWVKVGSEYNGGYQQWGWVIKNHLTCGGQTQGQSPASQKIVTVYGRSGCSLTKNMIEQLSQNGIPYIFKDIDSDAAAGREINERANQIGLTTSYKLPLIYINKNQWIKASPSPGTVINQFRS
jgi:glutaredoxin